MVQRFVRTGIICTCGVVSIGSLLLGELPVAVPAVDCLPRHGRTRKFPPPRISGDSGLEMEEEAAIAGIDGDACISHDI